jgi:hypothetical protein
LGKLITRSIRMEKEPTCRIGQLSSYPGLTRTKIGSSPSNRHHSSRSARPLSAKSCRQPALIDNCPQATEPCRHQRLQSGCDGLPDTERRPHRKGWGGVHRHLWDGLRSLSPNLSARDLGRDWQSLPSGPPSWCTCVDGDLGNGLSEDPPWGCFSR